MARRGFAERQSARNFAEMVKREGIARDFCLAGWVTARRRRTFGRRDRTATILSELAPPLTYVRAGMIVALDRTRDPGGLGVVRPLVEGPEA